MVDVAVADVLLLQSVAYFDAAPPREAELVLDKGDGISLLVDESLLYEPVDDGSGVGAAYTPSGQFFAYVGRAMFGRRAEGGCAVQRFGRSQSLSHERKVLRPMRTGLCCRGL